MSMTGRPMSARPWKGKDKKGQERKGTRKGKEYLPGLATLTLTLEKVLVINPVQTYNRNHQTKCRSIVSCAAHRVTAEWGQVGVSGMALGMN